MANLEIDADSSRTASQQLVDQLRYLIATGHYEVDDSLPSTRKLGDRLGISFHTVRKAYQQLEEDGLLRSKVGSGYRVEQRTPANRSERRAKGTAVIQETLKTLVGLGLSEAEIESLFREQSTLLDHAGVERTFICVGPYRELNALYAQRLGSALRHPVRPVPLTQLDQYETAEVGFAPYPFLARVIEERPDGETHGFIPHLPSRILERAARLRNEETLGLVARYQESIVPLSEQLREQTAYGGQVVSASIEEGIEHLSNVIERADLFLYTPKSKRRLLPFLNEDGAGHAEVGMVISPESVDAIQDAVSV